MRSTILILGSISLFTQLTEVCPAQRTQTRPSGLRFAVGFTEQVRSEPTTGRVYVMIARDSRREPRRQVGRTGVPFFGVDVDQLAPPTPAGIATYCLPPAR